jgi:dTDP-glucose 4,6-dehydratase
MILNALEGKSLPVYGDGQQIRDWLHVEDHCEAIHLVLTRGRARDLQYRRGQPARQPDVIVQTICDILDECKPGSSFWGFIALVRYVKTARARPPLCHGCGQDHARTGLAPAPLPDQGLGDTVNWYLSHPEWVAAIRKQQDYQNWLAQNYEKREKQHERNHPGRRARHPAAPVDAHRQQADCCRYMTNR